MQVCLFYVVRRKRGNGEMREPRRNGGMPLFLQKKPLRALLGFAIAACTMFAPATVASAAEATTDSQNIQATAEQVGTAGSDDDDRQNGGDANGGQAGDAEGRSDNTSGGTDNVADNANGDSDDMNNGAADNQSGDALTQDSNSAMASNDARIRLVPRIATKAQAHAQANAVKSEVILPSSWDDDMSRVFPDRVLRILVDRQVRIEFVGDDLSHLTTEEILSWVTGDRNSGKWNLYNAYDSWRQERINAGTFNEKEDRVKLLNGIQYLDGLKEIYAASVDDRFEGVGLQTFAFPGIGTNSRIPDLTLRYNNLHIFPNKIFPEGLSYNLLITRRGAINTTQDMYHHVAVTYVRDGKGGKRVEFLGGIYKLCDSENNLNSSSGAANGVDTCIVPIFDESADSAKKDFNTVAGMTMGAKTQIGFTATTGGTEAADGQLYRQVGYDHIAISADDNDNRDAYSFSYGYHLLVNYLSTVKQSSTIKVLGDFKFKKTSSGNSGVALKGAEYVLKTTEGKYIKGADRDGAYWASTDNDGALVTTTDKSKALRLVTGEQGTFTVRGIPGSKDGVDYLLEETKAPEGYETSSGDIHVKVRVAADLTTRVTGGEGTRQTVTADSVKADASDSDDWVNAIKVKYLPRGQTNPNQDSTNTDYANSGDAMILKGADGSTASAQSTKNASDYDGGADLFIKNHGNGVTFSTVASDDSSLPSDYRLEHQTSTLTDGTGKELLNSSDKDALAKVSAHVNGIINKGAMTKTTDYYNVNTVAVYHDTSSADDLNRYIVSDDGRGDQNVQRDKVQSVAVKFNAVKKLLKNGEKEPVKAGEFKFTLEPDEDGAPKLENATAEVGSDGIATWGALDFTADWWSGVKKDDGVADFTYTMKEVDTGSKKYDYDASVYKIRIKVSELEEYSPGETKGLTVCVYVNDELKLRVTSADTQKEGWKTRTVKVRSGKDPDATFVNTEKVTDFSFTKKDGETGDTLDGAEFQLYRYNGDCDATCKAEPLKPLNPGNWEKIDTQTSGEHGKVTFKDLTSDTYRLIESKAPSGYTRPSGQWNVVVDLGQTDKAKQITITAVEGGNKPPAFKHEQDGGLSVANYRAKTIPSTGGRGLIAFSLMGAMVVLGGGFVLSKRVFGEGALEA